jgi:hypothetical protein
VDDSKNCITALLHFIISFFIGRDSVFSSTNICNCNSNRRNVVHWQRRGSEVRSDTLLHGLLLQAVLLRSALQSASVGRVLWTVYLGYVFSHYLFPGVSFAVTSLCHGAYSLLTAWSFDNTYYTVFRVGETLPGPPQFSSQLVHSFLAISIIILCGVAVGILTRAVTMVSDDLLTNHRFCNVRDLWRSFKRDPRSCLPFALSLLVILFFLPGTPDHDAYIFKFFFVWLASQLCLAFFNEANSHCDWMQRIDEEFLGFWAVLWGFAGTVLKLLMTLDSFDYFLMVGGCLVLAYAFTAAILLNSRYRNVRSTTKLVTQQSILLLTTAVALYAMLPSALTATP